MAAYDDILKSCLEEARALDYARLKEELQTMEPHQFSREFEKKMEELMKRTKRKAIVVKFLQYGAVAACFGALVMGAVLPQKFGDLSASELQINIREWAEEFFTFEIKEEGRRKEGVQFSTEQVGYIPEGYELVETYTSFTGVILEYQNEEEEELFLNVYGGTIVSQVDNEDISYKVSVNSQGYEYAFIEFAKDEENRLMWKYKQEFYSINGKLEESEMLKIMDGIIEKGDK